ncbi:hypothetical protein PMIN01_08535 [Paraphaeosphaeria minitans]|uniref:Uncharacterized protein n=1 Tax=Paraphaeosphaeria minitans TaxID=565426 RepID=A0A9P6GD08_9PLEO|nr:hypothetical protein PMIN01_08535 [Paraphaeosphaeria minitans]
MPYRYVPITHGDESRFAPELSQTDAVGSPLFLDSTDMLYRKKEDDPWFSAASKAPQWLKDGLRGDPLYVSDEPATVIGCTSQVLYCNPKTDACASL